MSGSSLIDTIRAALQPHGLHLRGSLLFDGDGPLLADGRPASALTLVGNIGGSLWPAFKEWHHARCPDEELDPLDRWSKAVLAPLAQEIGATAFFPSDPPWQPFQHWAMRAEGMRASPLGILIHPRYGLWHGYRGALAFERVPDGFDASVVKGPHPCDTCIDRPCLAACPAGAIREDGFHYEPCRGFLGRAEGATCLDNGCIARAACPIGVDHRYPPEQIRFHMSALKRL